MKLIAFGVLFIIIIDSALSASDTTKKVISVNGKKFLC